MHHFHGPVGPATDGRAQGSRVRSRLFVGMAVLVGLFAAWAGDPGAYVRDVFQLRTFASLHLGAELALGADVELTATAKGGRQFDEGDAERQVSRERAHAEISAKRGASGTGPFLSARGSTPSDSLRGRIA